MNSIDTITAPAEGPLARDLSWRQRLAARRPLLWLTLSAISLRLVIFLGRGDYVAFDEGWYLLLGRNLFSGNGYTLTGLKHVTLSPLFPIVAGAVSVIQGNPIWAGRLVAAVAAGMLVWPCWYIFSRLADRRTAWIACLFVAVMPSLAAFAAPYWIRWDLWVGAEPLLHVFLYAALALALRGWERQRPGDWALAGMAFALAYLARPEALLPFGLVALMLLAQVAWRRTPRAALNALILTAAFALTAAPYWLYLHDALGRWTVTGRGVQVTAPRIARDAATGAPSTSPAARIEGMLWEDDQRSYMYSLYGLGASGKRLSSAYWGIAEGARDDISELPSPPPIPPVSPASTSGTAAMEAPQATSGRPSSRDGVRWALYARALAVAVPWYLWPFTALGLFGVRRAWRMELLLVAPLLITSFAIARIVAVDPRTQLFLVPLAAFYAARGVRRLGVFIERRWAHGRIRRGFAGGSMVAVLTLILLATEVRWVYMGLTLGSPHHLVGTANRQAGAALRDIVPAGEPVMSWHPAIALYARRDWRVLPYAPFDAMVRYANAIGSEYVVLSRYYPAPLSPEQLPGDYLLVEIPPKADGATNGYHVTVDGVEGNLAKGRLRAVEP